MRKLLTISSAIAALVLFATPALTQDAATVKVSQSEEYGQYLTDGDGRALYLFTADTQGQGETKAQVACQEQACLEAWPPFYAEGEPQAGEGADVSLLGTVDFKGKMMVTYNGWPLYYYAQDQGAGSTAGQDIHSFGGEWYLVSPEGKKVEGE